MLSPEEKELLLWMARCASVCVCHVRRAMYRKGGRGTHHEPRNEPRTSQNRLLRVGLGVHLYKQGVLLLGQSCGYKLTARLSHIP